jgi:hypothetical protein
VLFSEEQNTYNTLEGHIGKAIQARNTFVINCGVLLLGSKIPSVKKVRQAVRPLWNSV